MTDKQPETLKIADAIDELVEMGDYGGTAIKAAAELRRLRQSEREGWRYADELGRECKKLRAYIEASKKTEADENAIDKSVALRIATQMGWTPPDFDTEPVGYVYSEAGTPIKCAAIKGEIPNGTRLYTAPPRKADFVCLLDEDIADAANGADFGSMVTADDYIYIIARAVEKKLRERNG